jgi:hypothetical protein
MTVRLVARDPDPAWAATLDSLRTHLGATPADALADTGVNLWVGRDLATLRADLAAASPAARRRTIALGIAPGFRMGYPVPPPGSLAELLEQERLAGALAPDGLVTWQQMPSWFAGPQSLMEAAGTNALKAMQSRHYAIYFGLRHDSLASFLASYLPLVEQHATAV